MDGIKARLSIVIPGATMLSRKECEALPKNEAYESSTVSLEYYTKKGKKLKKTKETLHISTRKLRTAKYDMAITKEAYDYMTDSRNIPASPRIARIWSNMSIKQRLEYHFRLIAEDLNGISFTYQIFED